MIIRCERCNEILNEEKAVMLAYDTQFRKYTDEEIPAERDQGGFWFGKACAKHEKAAYETARKASEDA